RRFSRSAFLQVEGDFPNRIEIFWTLSMMAMSIAFSKVGAEIAWFNPSRHSKHGSSNGSCTPPLRRGKSDRESALRQLRGRERLRGPAGIVRQRHIWANVSGAPLFPGHYRSAQNYHRALRGRRRGAATFPHRGARCSKTIASPYRATLRLWRE